MGDRVFAGHSSAAVFLRESGLVCADPYCYVDVTPVVVEPEVQVSNVNSVSLLSVLGLGSDSGEDFSDTCLGSLPAEDFLGRVLLASAVAPVSAEVPTFREENMVFGGRVEGYVQGKLDALYDVALFAVENGREVMWG